MMSNAGLASQSRSVTLPESRPQSGPNASTHRLVRRGPKVWVLAVAALLLTAGAADAQNGARELGARRATARELVEFAGREPESPALGKAITATLGEQRIKAGTAWSGQGADFILAIESAAAPMLVVDERPQALRRITDSNLWYAPVKLAPGKNHGFYYMVEGKRVGGSHDVPAYLPESYSHENVPKGALSEKISHTSKIYDGMTSDYWVYVPAQYDAKTAAPVMVWTDGGGHIDRNGTHRTLNVVDNLIHQKQIPVSIHVFTSPGMVGQRRLRSIQYDTVNDTFVRYIVEEILAEVGQKHNLRKDGYSRAIVGDSSGAIAAFNAAWQKPNEFSRVLSRIGTFTSIQWKPGELDGGNIFPFAIRKTPRKNIRVWLSDGSEDLENAHGSWPLQNIQMANSLKMAGYDFHFSWSSGSHNGAHGAAEAPLSLAWLWRDYDPAKTEQVYEQDPAERTRPYYRVKIYNRD